MSGGGTLCLGPVVPPHSQWPPGLHRLIYSTLELVYLVWRVAHINSQLEPLVWGGGAAQGPAMLIHAYTGISGN